MPTQFFVWLIILALLGSFGCSGDSPSTPVNEFYSLYLKLRPSGLPTQEEEQAMAPYLSDRLLGLIDIARTCQETFKRKYPEEKPPWADGCLFSSLFEGPSYFKVLNVTVNSDGTSTVSVHFRYETTEWEDSLIVRKEANKFVIDDFVMSGAGPFNPPWRFSEGLKCPEK